MHALCYSVTCTASSVPGPHRFELRLADEGRIDVGVYDADHLVSGKVRTDRTTLYNVIHGWPVEARDPRSGLLRLNQLNGTVTLVYERPADNLRFEATVSMEDYARRVHSLGGPMTM